MSRKRLAWLLWFALLLPFAQVAVAAHELSHVQRAEAVSKVSAQPVQCDVCLVAAAVGSGGAASAAHVFTGLTFANEGPLARPAAPRPAEPPAFFHSRAPPPALKS